MSTYYTRSAIFIRAAAGSWPSGHLGVRARAFKVLYKAVRMADVRKHYAWIQAFDT